LSKSGSPRRFAAKVAVAATTRAANLCGGRAYRADHLVTRLLHDAVAGPPPPAPAGEGIDDLARQLFA
jgi:alkylation response protein AidB-like acyl-CoA dehydrogenase